MVKKIDFLITVLAVIVAFMKGDISGKVVCVYLKGYFVEKEG